MTTEVGSRPRPGAGSGDDPRDKGLSRNSVGLWSSVALGVSTVAPVYCLTATLGPTVGEVGPQMLAVFVAGFLPMFLVAYAYRELNRRFPDSGTSFTWTVKAFGPWVGWMCGWGLVVATIIVLSNLAGVAVTFFYVLLADVTGNPALADLAGDKWVNVLTCLVLVAAATAVSYRGITATRLLQNVLVLFQLAALVSFAVMAIGKAVSGDVPTAMAFDLAWFDPFAVATFSAFTAGLSLSIFMFWGWDTCLTLNEETEGSSRTPGRAALLTVLTILGSYLLVGVAAVMYAGVGDTGVGLGNPETEDNVFATLAHPVMGGSGVILILAVLASSAASLQSTFIPVARTVLAMGFYEALPVRFARVHPRFRTPSYATLWAGIGTGVFYSVMTVFSEDVLVDTIFTLGLMICFYYALTAYACVWYFRRELTASVRDLLYKGLLPGLGAVALTAVFGKTVVDMWDPAYGTGSSVFGVGGVFVIGVGVLLLGAVLMVVQSRIDPRFFRGETLRPDTGALVVPD
ncbi:amino acid transporter [Streptosporangium becharense]|uniref:Amino acid transporter n=1 Tax=Streptosporangium becharense TaxID=1816182 RepID=A0A7W9IF86_9ACTN|nr:APC family permease [Streptosporangium becharense]MBB2910007.1 amino acid transporter [Streptosporangium becharense]MBB5819038.1 amino acid transporter [Streptosporangium becharense]